MQANSSRGKVLAFLLQQEKDGKIPGIFGRLVRSFFSCLYLFVLLFLLLLCVCVCFGFV
jgi:hypothetical protein